NMVGRCHATGLAPASYRGIIAAAVTFGMTAAPKQPPWATDVELITAVTDLEDHLSAKFHQVNNMISEYEGRLEEITPSEKNQQLIAGLEASLEILRTALRRVDYAMSRLATVPTELGDTYAAAYQLIRSGRSLPYNGRWITGGVHA